mmetsp:Transcript_83959/g.195297  ORF Transcript_83959/g.195297 Transcript_83959/m.195297 type:complete len:217 (-) Transcript_83959:126-776(-)
MHATLLHALILAPVKGVNPPIVVHSPLASALLRGVHGLDTAQPVVQGSFHAHGTQRGMCCCREGKLREARFERLCENAPGRPLVQQPRSVAKLHTSDTGRGDSRRQLAVLVALIHLIRLHRQTQACGVFAASNQAMRATARDWLILAFIKARDPEIVPHGPITNPAWQAGGSCGTGTTVRGRQRAWHMHMWRPIRPSPLERTIERQRVPGTCSWMS